MLKKSLALALAIALAASAAYGLFAGGSDSASPEEAGGSDVPEVVAEVNGQEIPRSDFVEAYEMQEQAAAQQAQAGGQQPDEEQLTEQVVQSLVNEALLVQEADRRGIEPTEQQVQRTLTELAGQSGMKDSDQLVAALEEQGLDREEIDEQATQQTRFDMLVAEVAGPVQASEKEIRALYEQLSQQSGGQGGQQVPPLKQVRPQLVDQLESQQESQAARSLLDKLRKDADITVHV